ncbi:hypothetical protein JQ634_00805 [Bradyrhizobium sp. AUGA SZCCT0240]|uniref:hypothetical protein n=1 Tax=unclassified Bradyrhizobium TaxID=2631580 RepID=UPI001BAA5120|nr:MULTISPECIES: hypothetical protein [unclassified Bradyrhizobium]MBR1195903.1 hypothetical protein [Bradyrhizobium sp. AUGA SZCCT0158]MBR1240740.1 hypothetical protein [Bradyrhizobium sp. AUGA SZCCT0274]MBR1252236.1 hypothetical protein [Bradyrhizobium sp. AUGA SZCCT0240]
MRKVDRSKQAAPAALSKADKNGKTELARVRAHAAKTDPGKKTFEFKAYKNDEVKRRLEALFHGKCAYCETYYAVSAPVDVEHYRPKGRVGEDDTHPGYWWLAMDWENLLPSCIDCNRRREQIIVNQGSPSLAELWTTSLTSGGPQRALSGKQDSFPIAGTRILPEGSDYAAEQALLLDPCRDDPETHLAFHINHENPFGLVLPTGNGTLSARGATSIHAYGLNRLHLVQERTRLLRRLEFLGYLAIELIAMAKEMADPMVTAALPPNRANAISRRLESLAELTFAEMRAMAEPTESYSALARQWLREFRDGAKGSTTDLRYHHFTVTMDPRRRLAFSVSSNPESSENEE